MNELIVKLKETSIDSESSNKLENIFMPYFKQAEEWRNKSESIVIKSEDEIEKMDLARESRLALKNIRCEVERKRKELKADSLSYGKAIDGMANVIKFLIGPIEKHLEEQERFVQIKQENRLNQMEDDRKEKLLRYDVDIDLYDLRIISDEKFETLLNDAKELFKRRQELEKKAEEERIEQERKEKAENERIRIENEKLKKEAEKQAKIEAERQEKERKIELKRKAEDEKKAKIEQDRLIAEQKERDRLISIEREKQAKIQAELDAKQKAEDEAKEKELERQKAIKEAEKKKELAPDKEKLNQLAVCITSIEMPEVKSKEAKEIIKQTIELLSKTSSYIRNNTIKL